MAFTSNWYRALYAVMSNDGVKPTSEDKKIYVTNYSGITNILDYQNQGNSPYQALMLNSGAYNVTQGMAPTLTNVRGAVSDSSAGVIFGNGDAAPKPDDYCLSGDIITNLAAICTASRICTDEKVELTALYTITNNNNMAVTLSEVGLFASIRVIESNGGAAKKAHLVERTVLDNPITIEPGGVGQVTYTITMNYPTA